MVILMSRCLTILKLWGMADKVQEDFRYGHIYIPTFC